MSTKLVIYLSLLFLFGCRSQKPQKIEQEIKKQNQTISGAQQREDSIVTYDDPMLFYQAARELSQMNHGEAAAFSDTLNSYLSNLIQKTDKEIQKHSCSITSVKEILELQIQDNIMEKLSLINNQKEHFSLTSEDIKVRIVDYELFKLKTFLSAGVFPKKYFGYFDQKWDTAPYETEMIETIKICTQVCNRWFKEHSSPLRITDKALAVTFIAEGGALFLREDQEKLIGRAIHPILDIGLDDILSGSTQYDSLVANLDSALETSLSTIAQPYNDTNYTLSYMNFKEAIAGTALMYVYEKEICEEKLIKAKRKSLSNRDLEEQFILASLVYNSGILFSEERCQMIKHFTTADYIYRTSEKTKTKRALLSVFKYCQSLSFLQREFDYPYQPTSWNAVYHILQRYGAYKALSLFTDYFDEKGMFKEG